MGNTIQNLENILTEWGKTISDLKNKIKNDENERNASYKTLLLDFLQIIDTFEQAEIIIEEKKWNENEIANKAINRLLKAKKKAISVFEKHGVSTMIFENNLATDNDCKIIDTECDRNYPNNYILHTEKKGYYLSKMKDGEIKSENLRSAEVIIVQN